jgi:hypothetical protein
MKRKTALTAASIAVAALILMLLAPAMASAQSGPAVKIVLPERFRVLSQQQFDLRVEAVGLTNSTAQLQIIVNNGNRHDALQGVGAPEVTTNNDNDPSRMDKAWTFRRVSFGREGVRTLKAIITDGRNIYGAATQIGVQKFDLTGQKSIILYIGDAMGTAYVRNKHLQ